MEEYEIQYEIQQEENWEGVHVKPQVTCKQALDTWEGVGDGIKAG